MSLSNSCPEHFEYTFGFCYMSIAISLANLIPAHKKTLFTLSVVKVLDKILGVSSMDKLYRRHVMAGLDKEQFARKLLDVLNIKVQGVDGLDGKIPSQGPLVIASNHPFGGIEGVILCLFLGQIRPDLKVLANQGLKLFPELSDYFIFTNPLSENDPKNAPSLRTSLRHVKNGGALLVFPAGRVSYYQPEKRRVSEHSWNRIIGRLITASNAQFVPIFVSGQNSPLFYRLGRIYYRLRMLMLARELLNKKNTSIQISSGAPCKANSFNKDMDTKQHAALCRIQSYAQDPQWSRDWPADKVVTLQTLATEQSVDDIEQELSQLPAQQRLLTHKAFEVYFGYQHQMPTIVAEIARLRELVFREHNEGSGEPLDTDQFDATYTHLFVFNRHEKRIIGAYRMGQTDKLLADGNIDNLYLSRMFKFENSFVNRQQPCLEMGRSFLIPEYQRSFQGLYLLWRGIGAFVCQYPHYRTLYGTVSLSKLYDCRSVALIKRALITQTDAVRPYTEFDFELHPEINDFSAQYDLKPHLSALLACIEEDGKDIPILAKHYMKLGAQFHCLGIDNNFNDTPGLLLSVDLPAAPEKLLKLYLSEGWESYKNHQ